MVKLVGQQTVGQAPRTCGTCRACCKTMGIKEIDKPAGEQCPHINSKIGIEGCRIYSMRPQSCVDFRCLWLHGLGDERDRPDRSGAVMWTPDEYEGRVVRIAVAKKGIEDNPRIRFMIRSWHERGIETVISHREEFMPTALTIEGSMSWQ